MALTGISGADLLAGERDVDASGLGTVVGLSTDGTSWSVASLPGSGDLLIGQPTLEQVVQVTPELGNTSELQINAIFTAPAAAYGESIAVLPLPTSPEAFDLWVAAPDANEGRGSLYRYPGADAARDIESPARLVVRSTTEADHLGTHLFPCADLTGDGLPELVASIPWWQPSTGLTILDGREVPPLAGAIVVLDSEAVAEATGEQRPWDLGPVYWGTTAGAGVGPGVTCDRDLDGDGRPDLAVGEPRADDQAGAVHLIAGPLPDSGPLDEVAWRTIASPGEGAWFGESLAAFSWDSEPYLLIGAPGVAEGQGAAYLYRPLDELPLEPVGVYESSRDTPDHVGRTVAAADLDGDGQDELLVAAPDYRVDNNTFGVGRLWIFGRDVGLAPDLADATGILTDTQPFRRIGRDLVLTDIDGDDATDLWLPTQRE